MITICILPNFVGSKKEWIKATLICLALDSIYIVPMIIDFLY